MADESTIEVRGLWDQKPGTIKVPASIAQICHDFSKEQTIVLQDRHSQREDSAIFEPFRPAIISIREGSYPVAGAEDGLRWSNERARILFSSTGKLLHRASPNEKSSSSRGFGFCLLLGYVLRQRQFYKISILGGPVNSPKDSFVLLELCHKDRKGLNGFHIGGNPCTTPSGTFQSAAALVRDT